MRKAYDTILRSEVSAELVAEGGVFDEPYRFECACCGEEVRIAAAESTKQTVHFRHRSGNNDTECENYLGKNMQISIDSASKKSNRERLEFYFVYSNKNFCMGLKFTEQELMNYEQCSALFTLSVSETQEAFRTLEINRTNFFPDAMELIPLGTFSHSYYLTNTYDKTWRKYDFINIENTPAFFKVLGDVANFKARLVQGDVIYTNTKYFVTFQNQYYENHFRSFSVEDKFTFETMGKQFTGIIISFPQKSERIDALIAPWGYRLESSDTLTLLWPPASSDGDTSYISGDNAFIYSTFRLQAHGNINVNPSDVVNITANLSKVLIRSTTKVFRRNAELTISNCALPLCALDKLDVSEDLADCFVANAESTCFSFTSAGVLPLDAAAWFYLTPEDVVRKYQHGYLIGEVKYPPQSAPKKKELLNDLLKHYKLNEPFVKTRLNMISISETVSEYLLSCEESAQINSAAKRFIEEGRL